FCAAQKQSHQPKPRTRAKVFSLPAAQLFQGFFKTFDGAQGLFGFPALVLKLDAFPTSPAGYCGIAAYLFQSRRKTGIAFGAVSVYFFFAKIKHNILVLITMRRFC